MEPLALASAPKVEHQAAMVALGRPGAGEELLARCGFVDIERHEIPFVSEFADPETYARAISSVGPAYEAIENVGEEEFIRSAIAVARQRVRDGLPLRAPIASVGYVARKPSTARSGDAAASPATSFLDDAPPSPGAQRLFDDDVQGLGYVMNTSKLWAHDPAALDGLSELLGHVTDAGSLTFRQRAILVTACASALGDSYCSLAWGKKLAGDAGADVAEGVLRGDDAALDHTERALARWARQLARDPNSTTAADVQSLRAAGFDDAQIFAISVFVALRIAFSTVNDALGAQPDRQLGVDDARGSPRRRHVRPADRHVRARATISRQLLSDPHTRNGTRHPTGERRGRRPILDCPDPLLLGDRPSRRRRRPTRRRVGRPIDVAPAAHQTLAVDNRLS